MPANWECQMSWTYEVNELGRVVGKALLVKLALIVAVDEQTHGTAQSVDTA